MKEGQPKAIELKDYKVPPYLIDTTELHVEINEDVTVVTTTMRYAAIRTRSTSPTIWC